MDTLKAGALVDTKSWAQTIRVMVSEVHSTKDLIKSHGIADNGNSDIFVRKNSPLKLVASPSGLELGLDQAISIEEICLLVSVKTTSWPTFKKGNAGGSHAVYSSIEGTIFIHGLFFAHEAESFSIKYSGSKRSQYWPEKKSDIISKRKWERY